ncbi:MAG: hypothetical protein ACJ72L_11395 [Marmoricola sp.]
MSSELLIGKLRIRGGGRRVDPRTAVGSLDLAPRPEDRRVLFIRHIRVDPADPGAARERVELLRRSALRPAWGQIDPAAAAVEFADEAEAMLCLSRDVLADVARNRWWWSDRLPRHCVATGDVLEALWLARPRWIPSVLAALAEPDPQLAERAVTALGPAAADRVLNAVLAEHAPAALTWAAPSPPPELVATRRASVRDRLLVSAPAPSTAPSYALLTVATTLAGQPALAPRPEFAAWVAAVRSGSTEDLVPGLPRITRAAVSQSVVPVQEPAAVPLPEKARRRPPVSPDRDPLADQAPPDEPGDDGGAEVTPIHEARARRKARLEQSAPQRRPPYRYPPWVGSGPSTATAMATLLYAVNLVRRFELDRAADPGATGWAVVEAVGRWLLRGLPAEDRRRLLADPRLALLAQLVGRQPDVKSPVRLGPAARPVREFLAQNRVPVETFIRPGTVLISRTHVDVVLRIDQIDLAARACGLDQDPGWVPELGRIVLFHFEGGE